MAETSRAGASVAFDVREVIGLPLACTDYAGALSRVLELAGQQRPVAVALANTHIASAARRRSGFRATMRQFELVLPDGMPLVWSLNAQGAKLTDRVYGPAFMAYVVERTPAPFRHFLFGASDACLDDLEAALRRLQPGLDLVGRISPPFGAWTEEDETRFSLHIAQAAPDFIWVALGGEKQEEWIIRNRHRHQRGVFLAVGDAFELLAGRRRCAPDWMQRNGLTWLFRLLQEPRRLAKRYMTHNLLFIYYLLRERLPP